jgi:tRNA(Met) cytidine acetyltransferase
LDTYASPPAAAQALRTAIAGSGERRLLWLAGGAQWTLAAARDIVARLQVADTHWLGDRGGPADPNRRTAGLGGDCGMLVVDAWAGLDPDALGAAIGTLRGGGLLVLLTPSAADWPGWIDPATRRFATFPHGPGDVGGRWVEHLRRALASSPAVRRIDGPSLSERAQDPPRATGAVDDAPDTGTPTPGDVMPPAAKAAMDLSQLPPATPDQARAIDAILATARGRACRPLVITADRGRGKSAAMGLATARLRAAGDPLILLTAPRRTAAEAVLRHAGEPPPRYVAPDALLAATPAADLLLVDEAAAIPAPLLESMLLHYPRIVFATTVHGYEGTGRGFDVRFRAVLDRHTPGWRALRLTAPVRWADGDPLEALSNRALLLDAEPAADADAAAALADGGAHMHVETPERADLAADEPLLRQAFGLLVLGHYQTRPSDLRQLLDAPDIAVHLLRCGDTVLATAVTGREGRLPAELLAPIFAGRRRPQGHLLPQTLSAHAGLLDAPALGVRRILRIAVHPAARRRGLGRRLVAAIAEQAAGDGNDLLGASFGATPELLRFWRRCDLAPVHIGSRRNAASGVHAAVVLRALTPAGERLLDLGRRRLPGRLAVLLAGPLRDLEPAVAAALLAGATGVAEPLPDNDLHELNAFAHAARGLDATRPALHRLLRVALPRALADVELTPAQAAVLIGCGLQQREPADAAALVGATGAGAVLGTLREAVAILLAEALRQPPDRQVTRPEQRQHPEGG